MSSINDSKFNMWRACMAIIHVDGSVSKEENDWAQSKIESLPFSQEQREIITNDLASGLNADSVISKITHKPDLAFLLHLVRTIGHMDGCFSDSEKAAFKELENKILPNVDLGSLEKEINQMEERSYEPKKEKNLNKHSVFENAINNFRWWLGV